MELCLTSSEARNICRVRHYEERESPLALDHELHECLGSTAINNPSLEKWDTWASYSEHACYLRWRDRHSLRCDTNRKDLSWWDRPYLLEWDHHYHYLIGWAGLALGCGIRIWHDLPESVRSILPERFYLTWTLLPNLTLNLHPQSTGRIKVLNANPKKTGQKME
jgi:hypothetical protein